MVDYGSDGDPVGYDIQHASTKSEFIAKIILGVDASGCGVTIAASFFEEGV
jgi:hypothetical protein